MNHNFCVLCAQLTWLPCVYSQFVTIFQLHFLRDKCSKYLLCGYQQIRDMFYNNLRDSIECKARR